MKNKKIRRIIAVATVTAIVNTLLPIAAYAEWNQDSTGNWIYKVENKNAVNWTSINGQWYYFNESGNMATGWIKNNEKWYYLSESGAMKTGWASVGDKWYYLDQSGAMKTGWISEGDKWYYNNESGAMEAGLIKVDNNVYYLAENGEMKTGEVLINNEKYNFNITGEAFGEKIPPVEKIFTKDGQSIVDKQDNANDTTNNNNANNNDTSSDASSDSSSSSSSSSSHHSSSSNSSDTVAPTLPQKKNLLINIGSDSTTITWEKATDNKTLQDNLKYYLYESVDSTYNTISEWEANGILLNKDNLNSNSFELSDLKENHNYYFQLIVADEEGNKSLYNLEQYPYFTDDSDNNNNSDNNNDNADDDYDEDTVIPSDNVTFGKPEFNFEDVYNLRFVLSTSEVGRYDMKEVIYDKNDKEETYSYWEYDVKEKDNSDDDSEYLIDTELCYLMSNINEDEYGRIEVNPYTNNETKAVSNKIILEEENKLTNIDEDFYIKLNDKTDEYELNISGDNIEPGMYVVHILGETNDNKDGLSIYEVVPENTDEITFSMDSSDIDRLLKNDKLTAKISRIYDIERNEDGSITFKKDSFSNKLSVDVKDEEGPVLENKMLSHKVLGTTDGGATVELNWDKASDNKTTQQDLVYKLYMSEDNFGDDISKWEDNADEIMSEMDVDNFIVWYLDENRDYYFKLVVIDEDENKTSYTTEMVNINL